MMKIKISTDCGNSPKNLFLRDFSLAFTRGDSSDLLSRISNDFVLTVVGERKLQGRQALAGELESLPLNQVREVEISHVLSHGKTGAVDGTVALLDGGKLAVCCVFEFSSAKGDRISRIIAYIIRED